MSKKICFFSHNWGDGKDDFKRMLKDKIMKLSNSEINVIFDKDDFLLAEDLEDKENIITHSTTVVIFLSPEYKKSVETKDESKGTYREYKKIINRLSYDKGFLIPVLISGNQERSVPNELKKIIYQDASKNNAFYDEDISNFKSTNDFEIERLAHSIIDITNLLYKINSDNFNNSIEKINELIYNNHSRGNLPSKCMVLTDAYKQIIYQQSFVFAGRKGSGKTTLKEIIENYDPQGFAQKYKNLYPVTFDLMNIEMLYDIYDEIIKSNINVFRPSDFLEMFWELFFTYCSMLIITREYENHRIKDDVQRNRIEPLYNHLKNLLSLDLLRNIDTKVIFTFTCDTIKQQYKKITEKYHDNNNINTILVSSLTAYNIARSTVGHALFSSFETIVKRCQKKIMIFADGIDSNGDAFSITSKSLPESQFETKIRRDMFEIDFYKGIISLVTNIKEDQSGSYFSNIHFCIILPEDTIEKIRLSDRDFIKKRISHLRWDAYYLVNMINKRLSAVTNNEIKSDHPFDDFENYMKRFYPQIPTQYVFKTDKKEMHVDIFNYFLSLSFWRPRDILIHLAYVIGAVDDGTNDKINERTLRALLYRSSKEIIENEFFKEYKNTIFNLDQIIFAFENKSIVLSAQECYKTINNITFLLTAKKNIEDFRSKMRFLYEIGFIGVVLPNDIKERYEFATEYCFIYNEGIQPFDLINFDADLTKIKFVINHLFYSFLNLNYNSECFIEDFSKDYFISNHQTRSLITNY